MSSSGNRLRIVGSMATPDRMRAVTANNPRLIWSKRFLTHGIAAGLGGNSTARTPWCGRVGIVLVLLLAVASGASQSTEQIGAITSALRAGQFDRALELLQPVLQHNPKNAQLWALEGITFSGKSDKKKALDAFQHALDASPEYLPALEGAAQIEYDNGGKDAATLLQRVVAIRPHDATSHAMLAVLAYRRGDCSAAVPHFEQSAQLLDSQPDALQAYGDCLVRLKDNEKAIAVFSRVVDRSNGSPLALYRLASVQMMAQRPKDALATLHPLLQENTTDTNILELAAAACEADD